MQISKSLTIPIFLFAAGLFSNVSASEQKNIQQTEKKNSEEVKIICHPKPINYENTAESNSSGCVGTNFPKYTDKEFFFYLNYSDGELFFNPNRMTPSQRERFELWVNRRPRHGKVNGKNVTIDY